MMVRVADEDSKDWKSESEYGGIFRYGLVLGLN